MRTKTMVVMVFFALGLMFGVCPSVYAIQGHESTGSSKVTVPATVAEILTAVDLQIADLEKTITANALDKVHVTAFSIRDLLLALPEKASALSPIGKATLTSSLSKIKQQAGLLDKYGDAGDLAQTKAVFVKFKDEIEKIKQIPGIKP